MTILTIVKRASQRFDLVPLSKMSSETLGRYNAGVIAYTTMKERPVTKATAFPIGSAKARVDQGILAELVLTEQ